LLWEQKCEDSKWCVQATSRRERDDETDYGDNGVFSFVLMCVITRAYHDKV